MQCIVGKNQSKCTQNALRQDIIATAINKTQIITKQNTDKHNIVKIRGKTYHQYP